MFSNSQITILKIFTLFFGLIILKSSIFFNYIEKFNVNDFCFFFGYLIFFLLLLFHVNDFFLLFFLFEVISLLLYLLIIYSKKFLFFKNSIISKNFTKYQYLLFQFFTKSKFLSLNIFASLTYFLLNISISCIFLLGLNFLILCCQTTNFIQILIFLYFNYFTHDFIFFFSVILLCFLIMFLFKLSIVPFHWWITAVFESSSILVLMFLTIPLKFTIFFLFCKLFIYFFSILIFYFQFILLIFSILSMLVGTLGLFNQNKLKKFWAYSTVNHMGYLFLALIINNFLGLRAFLVYLFFYIFVNLIFFILLQCLVNETLNQRVLQINQLVFLFSQKTNWLMLVFSLIIFSLIGIPPLLGFWGKYLVISSILINLSFLKSLYLLFVIILTSVLSGFCYLKIWKTLFVEKKKKLFFKMLPIPLFHSVVLVLFSFLFFLSGFVLLFNLNILTFFDLFFFNLFIL
jgi:NADH-quinone oxidoreductase subunit N